MANLNNHGVRQSGIWLVLGAAVLWGTTGTAQALAPEEASPLTVGTVRLVFGGLALLAFAYWNGSLRGSTNWPRLATLLAAGCMAGYQVFFFTAVASTGVAVGTMVAIGSAPVLAGLLAYVLRGERPGRCWGLATSLTILGCILLMAAVGEIQLQAVGIGLALGAGACYAGYAVTSKGLLEIHQPDAVMAVIFCLGAVMLLPILLLGDVSWLREPNGLAAALHLGLVATTLSYALFARGLKLIPVSTAVTLTLAEPLTAGLLGVIVLGEQLNVGAWMGMGLIFLGLALLSLRGR